MKNTHFTIAEKSEKLEINATFMYTLENWNEGETSIHSIYFSTVSRFYTIYFIFVKGPY